MVEVVAPLRIHAKAAGFARLDHARIVEVAFGDQHQLPSKHRRQDFDFGRELLHKVDRRAVHELVHGIEPQAVDVVVAQPHQGVVAEEAPHLVAARVLEVDGVAPGSAVAVGQVGAELRGVVSHRPEVVVDHIDQNGKAAGMAGVDEALEAVGAAVVIVHGEQGDAVVAPAIFAGKLDDGHQLDMGDAQFKEIVEPFDRGVEGSRGGEGADVHLVDDGAGERRPLPALVAPRECFVVVEPRRAVNSMGLPQTARIGIGGWIVVEQKGVVGAAVGRFDRCLPPSCIVRASHGIQRVADFDGHLVCVGRPHAEFMHRFAPLSWSGVMLPAPAGQRENRSADS